MCGIAGLLSSNPRMLAAASDMGNVIHHRGPDDGGVWQDADAGVAFAHRRLAIVDLSPTGAQPMNSNDGRYTLAFNGEIYNHMDIRRELEPAGAGPWRGTSDTETLLEAIAQWGLAPALERSAGMFALALWDRRERRLLLARDRFGEKPLYFGWVGGAFAFASELKALRALPGFDNAVDREALSSLLRLGYVRAPHSIYRRIYKLEPGCILSCDPQGALEPADAPPVAGATGRIRVERYWSYADVVADGLDHPFAGEAEALEALDGAMRTSIGGQMMADVPIGAFLSGGIDSSTVVALYSAVSPRRISTYTIGFDDPAFDESAAARAIAAHLGTDHHEQRVSADDARDLLPDMPRLYDEPFGDSSALPTYLVSRFARQDVTVALSGDGGDELFGGYNRHIAGPAVLRRTRHVPRALRRVGGRAAGALPPRFWNEASRFLPGGKRQPHFGTKVSGMLRAMGGADEAAGLYGSFVDRWHGNRAPVLGTDGASGIGGMTTDLAGSPAVRMMYADAIGYLPDDILCKVDRAAMANSLETRVPFLDHRVAAVAARMSDGLRFRSGRGKHIVRALLGRYVPEALWDRPKTGFSIPVGAWLRGPLRPWVEELLDPARLAAEGLLDPAPIRAVWQRHLSGASEEGEALWPILMFQAWLGAQARPASAALSRAA